MTRSRWVRAAAAGALAAVLAAGANGVAAQDGGPGADSRSASRFVSLKFNRTLMRRGPDRKFMVDWEYTRAGLPLEVTAESGAWRRVRDIDGDEGWIHRSQLSGERTAILTGAPGEWHDLRVAPDYAEEVSVSAESGLIAKVLKCDGHWCELSIRGYEGWIEQSYLWGVYPGETFQ